MIGTLVERTIAAFEARRQFGQLLRGVEGRKDSFIIEWHGRPAAALVPLEVYHQWRAQLDRAFALMEQAAATANLSDDAADELAQEAVNAVRAATRP